MINKYPDLTIAFALVEITSSSSSSFVAAAIASSVFIPLIVFSSAVYTVTSAVISSQVSMFAFASSKSKLSFSLISQLSKQFNYFGTL